MNRTIAYASDMCSLLNSPSRAQVPFPRTMNARQMLQESGYIVLYNVVSEEAVNNLRSVARHEELGWNNGTWNGEAFDPMRPTARLPDALSRQLTVLLRRHYLTFFPHPTVTEWSFLRTMAGAADQPIRRDFPPPGADNHAANLATVPGLLLVATQDDTVMYGFGWNRRVALRSNREMIHLNAGDLMMFRGDFMYGNAGYETNNLLVQAYLDTPFYHRIIETDQPEVVALIDDVSAADDLFCYA
jgi:hypothetical protein